MIFTLLVNSWNLTAKADNSADGAHPISPPRLSSILESSKPVTTLSGEGGSLEPPNVPDLLDNFVHITTPTLAHLIALLCHSIPDLFTPSTSLLIIDSLCALVDSAFPKSVDSANVPKKPGGMTHHFIFSIICFPYLSSPSGYRLSGFGVHITDVLFIAPNPSARKFPVLQHIVTSFHKLAATYNISIVILSQCVTKMRPGAGAALVPSINTTAWEQGLACRVALFRDWGWDKEEDGGSIRTVQVRFAEVLKAEGVTYSNNTGRLVPFEIVEVCHISLLSLTWAYTFLIPSAY